MPKQRAPIRSLSSLDREILKFVTRFQFVRSHHIAAWTQCSPWWLQERLPVLVRAGLLKRFVVSVDLRRPDGSVTETFCHVWETTGKGAEAAGEWEVPGEGGATVSLPARKMSRLTSHHVLGVVDLAVWYRQFGYDVAGEREIRSLEQPTALMPGRLLTQNWVTKIPGRLGVHPPDLGVVHPDGGMWAIELERATKTVAEYREVIRSYKSAGLGQVWHILSQATARRVLEASTREGIIWAPPPVPGVTVSAGDGLIRLIGWVPGRAGLSGPKTWRDQFPHRAPAGIEVPTHLPDLSATWRKKTIKDVRGVQGADSGGWLL